MTLVRLSPRMAAPAQVQAPHAARALAPLAKKQVDGFERKSVAARLLQRGTTGAAVSQLQQRLVAAKFLSVTDFKSGPGVYGPRTEAAVKRLQARVGLPVTGSADSSTLAALAGGARYEPVVIPRLSETFTDEVTQPMGRPIGL